MISFAEAIAIILSHTQSLPVVKKPLLETVGLVLAEDVYSPIDIPGFDQSAMDGYALTLRDKAIQPTYHISGEVAAGDQPERETNPNDAVRIFTGAALPEGFDTVIIQEKTNIESGTLIIVDENLKTGNNVRLKGTEIKKGALAIKKGAAITPATIGYLAGMGISEVNIFPKPKVSLIITGNELVQPGEFLDFGQIYDANSYTLSAALHQDGISDIQVVWVKDDLDKLTETLRTEIEESDLVIFTGGISVGKYDFVLEATQNNDVNLGFYKVKQRPGKPIYFGTKNETIIFGLPGNPASVLTCYYVYVTKVIDILSNHHKQNWTKASLTHTYEKANSLTYFLKGYYEDGKVSVLEAQESFRLSSFSTANCLIGIDESVMKVEAGGIVDILLLTL